MKPTQTQKCAFKMCTICLFLIFHIQIFFQLKLYPFCTVVDVSLPSRSEQMKPYLWQKYTYLELISGILVVGGHSFRSRHQPQYKLYSDKKIKCISRKIQSSMSEVVTSNNNVKCMLIKSMDL